MSLDETHPSIADLKRRARRRVPHFVWEYLDSGTGTDSSTARNRTALDAVILSTRILRGETVPDLGVRLLGRDLALPIGIAPVGMSGIVWPDAEGILARLAAAEQLPYCLSTVAAQTPEALAPHIGTQGWFQLYPPRDPEIRRDMLRRAAAAGFHTLVLTADVPVASRRERLRRAQLKNPMRLTPRILWQAARRPRWSLATLRHGMPRLATLEAYTETTVSLDPTQHAGYRLRVAPDWRYLAALRREWPGTLVVKGVLDPADAVRLAGAGVDAVWVSNHGGRQFDAAPASIDALPAVRRAVGPDCPLIFDGGVASGLDVLRALARGADLVMVGRAFHYGLAAFGARGAAHALHIQRADIEACMGQMGIARPAEAVERRDPGPAAG